MAKFVINHYEGQDPYDIENEVCWEETHVSFLANEKEAKRCTIAVSGYDNYFNGRRCAETTKRKLYNGNSFAVLIEGVEAKPMVLRPYEQKETWLSVEEAESLLRFLKKAEISVKRFGLD